MWNLEAMVGLALKEKCRWRRTQQSTMLRCVGDRGFIICVLAQSLSWVYLEVFANVEMVCLIICFKFYFVFMQFYFLFLRVF